jgi:hypothetical protein
VKSKAVTRVFRWLSPECDVILPERFFTDVSEERVPSVLMFLPIPNVGEHLVECRARCRGRQCSRRRDNLLVRKLYVSCKEVEVGPCYGFHFPVST